MDLSQPETFSNHNDIVRRVTINQQSQLIASGGFDELIQIHDLQSNSTYKTLKNPHYQSITCMKFTSTSDIIITGSQDKQVYLNYINNPDKNPIGFRAHNGIVQSFDFYKSNNNIFTSGADGKIKLWDLEQQKQLYQKYIGIESINSIKYNHGMVFTGDTQCCLKIWDPKNGKLISNLQNYHTNALTSISTSNNSNIVSSTSLDGTVILWDLRMTKVLRKINNFDNQFILVNKLSDDGNKIAFGGHSMDLNIYSPITGKILSNQQLNKGYIMDIDISLDNKFIVYSARNQNKVQIQYFQ